MGPTWSEAEMVAMDRIGWRQRVDALCSARARRRSLNNEAAGIECFSPCVKSIILAPCR